jgi:hypothetical protein
VIADGECQRPAHEMNESGPSNLAPDVTPSNHAFGAGHDHSYAAVFRAQQMNVNEGKQS